MIVWPFQSPGETRKQGVKTQYPTILENSSRLSHLALELYKVSERPNREQPPREPEDVEGDME